MHVQHLNFQMEFFTPPPLRAAANLFATMGAPSGSSGARHCIFKDSSLNRFYLRNIDTVFNYKQVFRDYCNNSNKVRLRQ